MDRAVLLSRVRDHLKIELDAALAMGKLAEDEATHTETKAENKYDTRGLEASYLAAGQGRRIMALRQQVAFVALLEPDSQTPPRANAGVFARLEGDEGFWWAFLLPAGGGARVVVDGETVRVISTSSPLGRALLGAEDGDEVTWSTPNGERSGEVVRLA